jgi:hypothetical protein
MRRIGGQLAADLGLHERQRVLQQKADVGVGDAVVLEAALLRHALERARHHEDADRRGHLAGRGEGVEHGGGAHRAVAVEVAGAVLEHHQRRRRAGGVEAGREVDRRIRRTT